MILIVILISIVFYGFILYCCAVVSSRADSRLNKIIEEYSNEKCVKK